MKSASACPGFGLLYCKWSQKKFGWTEEHTYFVIMTKEIFITFLFYSILLIKRIFRQKDDSEITKQQFFLKYHMGGRMELNKKKILTALKIRSISTDLVI